MAQEVNCQGQWAQTETASSLVCLSQEYLRHFYGYKAKTGRKRRATDSGIQTTSKTCLCNKLRKMQRYFGLPPTGELTKDTLKVMRKPRCGLSDAERFGQFNRWKKRRLSYRSEMIRKQHSSHG